MPKEERDAVEVVPLRSLGTLNAGNPLVDVNVVDLGKFNIAPIPLDAPQVDLIGFLSLLTPLELAKKILHREGRSYGPRSLGFL
jgi:hypothetical protein